MRRWMGIWTVILLSSVLTFAQGNSGSAPGHDNANNSQNSNNNSQGHGQSDEDSPVQIGYAVVTPIAVGTNGLVAFETFGLKRGQDTTETGILPSGLVTGAAMYVNSDGQLSKNLGVAIVNPGGTDASVTMSLKKADGTEVGNKVVVVPALHQVSQFVTELFSGNSSMSSDFTGTLVLTSTKPVGIVGLRFRGINFSAVPVTATSALSDVPALPGGAGGPGSILLPQFAAGGGWSTEVVLANLGTSSATVRLDLFAPDGTPLTATLNNQSGSSFTNLTIPAGGVIILTK